MLLALQPIFWEEETPAPTGPTIDTQPSNDTVNETESASFTVAATTSGGALSYQWERDDGGGYDDLPGETAATLTLTGVTVGMSGYLYRCKVTDSNGTTTSSAATLTVNDVAPSISANPSNTTVDEGALAGFSVTASSAVGATLSYQWQDDSSGSFADISGATSSSLSVGATFAMSGRQYRCRVTDVTGSTTSTAATLTVTQAAPTITDHPDDLSRYVGQNALFAVSYTGSGVTVQWQEKIGGGAFGDLPGETGSTYLKSNVQLADSTNQYRAVVTNGAGSANSNAATLTVTEAPAGGNTGQIGDDHPGGEHVGQGNLGGGTMSEAP